MPADQIKKTKVFAPNFERHRQKERNRSKSILNQNSTRVYIYTDGLKVDGRLDAGFYLKCPY